MRLSRISCVAFIRHGVGGVYDAGAFHILKYAPFAALAIIGPMLSFAAWIRKLRRQGRKLNLGKQALS